MHSEAGQVTRGACCAADDEPEALQYVPQPVLPPLQIAYRVYESSELKPVLDAVNDDMTKEKEKEK